MDKDKITNEERLKVFSDLIEWFYKEIGWLVHRDLYKHLDTYFGKPRLLNHLIFDFKDEIRYLISQKDFLNKVRYYHLLSEEKLSEILSSKDIKDEEFKKQLKTFIECGRARIE